MCIRLYLIASLVGNEELIQEYVISSCQIALAQVHTEASPISLSCRSDIEIFLTGRCHSCNGLTVVKKTVCKMGQTGHAEFIRL